MATTSAGLTLGFISDSLFPQVQSASAALQANILPAGTDPSPSQLLEMQKNLALYTFTIEMQSTLTKTMGDSIKGVIQKSS